MTVNSGGTSAWPRNLRWDCDKKGCYKEELPNWGILNGCWPRSGIRVTDIDGMVHLGGSGSPDRFLFIEKKPLGCSLTEGQRHAYKALSHIANVTFIVLRGDGPEDVQEMLCWPSPGIWKKADVHALRGYVTAWANGDGDLT